MSMSAAETQRARLFAEAFPELLRAHQRLPLDRINLRLFFEDVEGWDYSTLRRMVVGDITLQPEALEAIARALDVSPRVFVEYRLHEVCEILRAHPALVSSIYDQVMAEALLLEKRESQAVAPTP